MLNEIFNFEKLFDTFNYVFWFFILNLLFWIFNIPIILFFVFIGIGGITTYFPLFLVCLLPTAPMFTVILYCVNKIYKNKTISLVADFIRGVKLNFVQALVMWAIELIIIFILYSNIKFFTIIFKSLILNGIFVGILILLAIITPFLFLIISRFSMKNIEVLRLSFTLTFTRPILTITNILLILVFLILFEINSAILLFVSSIFAFCLVFVNRTVFKELEDISKRNNE
ncbi:DUF624 domain-containing protein [Candidatus Arthromitus sp. SFB-rat-Yit]|uniref:DUF624 domain-containing protein n=1 Tax=Candidatus Arthromitus sp. SFB-rat-Yit TaxID=1041504 RepID=UPI000227A07C|nr:DUF624 domain-containing protein [Candidatus Arthromitus sp. SFB-rat-Yit]BAK81223.1 putative membrane protein [Candidatus Arthromitus sp. SFB-rat-Yit]